MLWMVLAYQPETRKQQHSERQDYILLCSRVAALIVLMYMYIHARFGVGPSQLNCLGILAGRALCLECRVSSVMASGPSSFFLGKVTALGILCCFALLFV